MLNVGDMVFVLPSESIKFGGRWGEVAVIDTTALPIGLKFTGEGGVYKFSFKEILTMGEYASWFFPGMLVLNKETGVKDYVIGSKFPYVELSSGCMEYATNLLPIIPCRKCQDEMIGEFQDLCENCQYPF